MHTYSKKKKDCTKKMAIFWVNRQIKLAALEYDTYKSWNVKIIFKIDVLDDLRNYLKTKSILNQDWEKVKNFYITMSSTKYHIRN